MKLKIIKPSLLTASLFAIALLSVSTNSIADQPKMQAALDALIIAENQLKKGSHDKGGHRAKALALVKKAKKQVKKAIKYDRKH
jgi:hypothetical protein